MTNEKLPKGSEALRWGVAAFLVFIVFSSKGILIYNEEILVALGFFGFVAFVSKSYGKDIQASLDVRGEGVKQKVAENLESNKKSQELLLNHWEAQNPVWCSYNEKRAGQAESLSNRLAASENFMLWFSSPLAGSGEGLFKASMSFATWNLLKGDFAGSSNNVNQWSNTFRQRLYGKVFEAVSKGDKRVQQDWVASSLASVGKMDL